VFVFKRSLNTPVICKRTLVPPGLPVSRLVRGTQCEPRGASVNRSECLCCFWSASPGPAYTHTLPWALFCWLGPSWVPTARSETQRTPLLWLETHPAALMRRSSWIRWRTWGTWPPVCLSISSRTPCLSGYVGLAWKHTSVEWGCFYFKEAVVFPTGDGEHGVLHPHVDR